MQLHEARWDTKHEYFCIISLITQKGELQRSTKEEASVLTMPVCDVMMACQVSRYSCTY